MFRSPRLLLCSVSATTVAFATPAFAQQPAVPPAAPTTVPPATTALPPAPPQAVTPQEAEQCQNLDTVQERDLCLQGQTNVEGTAADAGELATIPPPEAEETKAESVDIVVTGSRLRTSPYTSPDPITVIDPELALKQGNVSTAEILQQSIVAAGSTQITSFLSTNFVTNGGPGAQTLSLRGLGAERTLVLLNGRRAGPAGTRGAVSSFDLNVLPSSIVESVEVLKTGASSVYGSDAIAGVVNVKTRRSTKGLELRGFVSAPVESGGETYDLSATYGKDFGNGHFLVAASYFRRNELKRGDRDFLGCTEDYIFNEAGDRVDLVDPRTGKNTCTGDTFGPVIALSDFQADVAGAFGIPDFLSNLRAFPGAPFDVGAIQYNDPRNPSAPFVQALRPCENFIQFCAPGNVLPVNYDAVSTAVTNFDSGLGDSVIPKTDLYTFYANGSYNLSDSVEVFGEFLYNKRKTKSHGSRQIFPQQFTGSSALPYLFGYSDQLFSGDPFNQEFSGEVILIPVAITNHFGTRTDVDYYRGVVGADGDFGSFLPSWQWNVWGQYSRSDGDYESDIVFQDAFDTFNLRTQSCEGTVTSIRGVPCVDIDFTDPRVLRGEFTPEEAAFLLGTDKGNTVYTQWTGEASANGNVIDLPAGPLQAALGVQWRRDEINDVPGPATQAGNSWGLTSAGITAGHQITSEAFGEVELPLIYNTPFIQRFNLNGAARITNVFSEREDGVNDSSHGNWTYKVGANWQVNDWLRFRGTYGTSYRAPALFEQFLNDQTSFASQVAIDPCIHYERSNDARLQANCAAAGVPEGYTGGGTSSALILSGGGIGVLDPETSTAKTASVILTPQGWLWDGGRFSLAVDYFDIKVEGEIASFGSANVLSGCYNSEFFPDDPLCSLFVRETDPNDPRDNQIIQVRNPFLNINKQRNRGIDVTGRFTQDMGRWGNLSLLAQMTWQLEDKLALFEGTETDDNGEMGDPKWVGAFDATWSMHPWTVVYGLDVIGGTSDRQDVIDVNGDVCFDNVFRGTICPDFRGEPTFYHSASITLNISDRYDFTLGVRNIFDTKPARVSAVGSQAGGVFGQAPINGTQYDYLGRRIFGGITARF
jgi:iron complex outermembrane receptor protein